MSLPRSILIVDDEELLVTTLVRYFGGRGYAPTGVHGVAEALAAIETSLAEKQPFAAILTDLQLPDGDGGRIVQVAHDRLPHCPVLVMTGSGSVSASVEAMRLGALTVLEKPMLVEKLRKMSPRQK